MSARLSRFLFLAQISSVAIFLAGCETMPQGIQQARIEAAKRIQAEPPGDYFIGRRYFKPDYKFWGYVRKPGQQWATAPLVMLNEKYKLAPDREQMNFGNDNNYEYKLTGYFSGETVYEPASNSFYPEFVVKSFELMSVSPTPIFKSQYSSRAAAENNRYHIEKPE
jgi:hypothetical protein